jgi:ribosomal-protein-alanine N-acetyltransferase
MLFSNFNPFPILVTERLVLRSLENEDVKEIFFLRTDERVLRFLDRPGITFKEEAAAYIQNIHDLVNNSQAILWGITVKGDKKLIGTICFWHFENENYRAETGYVLHPDHQGKGIMQEAMSCILNYGFNIMKLHSVTANINPENTASKQLLIKCGFVKEACFKENFFYNGKFLDTEIFVKRQT